MHLYYYAGLDLGEKLYPETDKLSTVQRVANWKLTFAKTTRMQHN